MRLNLHELHKLASLRKLTMLTCYDASFARLLDECGVDCLLIGDSLGMTIQGHDSTLPVTVADIAYHTRCVVQGAPRTWVIADLPFGSYQQSPQQALTSSVVLMQAGAQMVKLEGGQEMAPTVRFLVERGIPVCGHIGLTPQHVNVFGGYRVQGRGEAATAVKQAAVALEQAGAAMLVIEAVPEALAREVAQAAKLLTIGIGASAACHGQVLVLQDMLGITRGRRPRFVKDYSGQGNVEQAVKAYVAEVQQGAFPTPSHTYE